MAAGFGIRGNPGAAAALAATQGALRLCTYNAACKDDDMMTNKWDRYSAHLLQHFGAITNNANMVALQEVSGRVWHLLLERTTWKGHWHSEQRRRSRNAS